MINFAKLAIVSYKEIGHYFGHSPVGSSLLGGRRNLPLPLWQGLNFWPTAHKLLYARQDLKAGALSEFEFTQRVDERRGWRGGVASGEGQRADL